MATTQGTWTPAIQSAVEYFGLKLPVVVKVDARGTRTFGTHRLMPVGGGCYCRNGRIYHVEFAERLEHWITVRSWLDREAADRTLWHELTHAMQAEREIPADGPIKDRWRAWMTCSARGRGVRYLDKPIEIEAREHEVLAADQALTKEA